jgi:hypothetical protein
MRTITFRLVFSVVLALLAGTVSAQSWSVAIEENPMLTSCGAKKDIPVAGAKDCPTATAAAWDLLQTLLQTPNCMSPGCPIGTAISPGVSTCTPDPYTRPNGSKAMRWQVSWTWKCGGGPPLITVPCCKCLGGSFSVDLSTGQSSPVDSLWKVNGGNAFTTPPFSSWGTLPAAKWIQPVASPTPSPSVPPGVYKYTVPFTVPTCTIPMGVRLDGKFLADNSAKVFLDTTQVASCPGPSCFSGTPTSFSIPSIAAGIHTLRIEVTNISGPSGLIVSAALKGQCKQD